MDNRIQAKSLTTFDVNAEGTNVQINVQDVDDLLASLQLPTQCLNQLLMTIPRMLQAALRNSGGDRNLRLVHPINCFTIERGERNADGELQFILTLDTGGGFYVSFSASEALLGSIVQSVVDDVLGNPAAHAVVQLNS